MISWLTSTYIGKLVATFIISMMPIVELRGGLPYGVGFGLSPLVAFAAAVLGNMLPIPFVLLLLNGILKWMKTQDNFLGKTALWLENKAYKNKDTIEKYGSLGLMILVAIPLPGTGAWTGALGARDKTEDSFSFDIYRRADSGNNHAHCFLRLVRGYILISRHR